MFFFCHILRVVALCLELFFFARASRMTVIFIYITYESLTHKKKTKKATYTDTHTTTRGGYMIR